MNPHQMREDEIGRKLQEAQKSGELASAQGYGQPLKEDEGWALTPDALRMPFKILKDAGVVPYEVELLNERARLRLERAGCSDDVRLKEIQLRLSSLEQSISLRLEALKRT